MTVPHQTMFAICTVLVVYPFLLNVGSLSSHSTDRVGEKLHIPHLSEFITYRISLFSYSFKLRLLWKEQTSHSYSGYSPTR